MHARVTCTNNRIPFIVFVDLIISNTRVALYGGKTISGKRVSIRVLKKNETKS